MLNFTQTVAKEKHDQKSTAMLTLAKVLDQPTDRQANRHPWNPWAMPLAWLRTAVLTIIACRWQKSTCLHLRAWTASAVAFLACRWCRSDLNCTTSNNCSYGLSACFSCIIDSMCPCFSSFFVYLFNGLSVLETRNIGAPRPLYKTMNIHWVLMFLYRHNFIFLITNDSYPLCLISEPWMRAIDIQCKSVNHTNRLNIHTGKQTKWSQKITSHNFMGLALLCPPFHSTANRVMTFEWWEITNARVSISSATVSHKSNCVCSALIICKYF